MFASDGRSFGCFRSIKHHISKGLWTFSDQDHGWQVSDSTVEGLKICIASCDILDFTNEWKLDVFLDVYVKSVLNAKEKPPNDLSESFIPLFTPLSHENFKKELVVANKSGLLFSSLWNLRNSCFHYSSRPETLLAPIQVETPVCQLLAEILQTHPHLLQICRASCYVEDVEDVEDFINKKSFHHIL